MNISLQKLQVQNAFYSPFLSKSSDSCVFSYSLIGFFVQRFGNSLFFSQSKNGFLKCENSRFRNFLKPVLNLDEATTDIIMKMGYYENCIGTNGGALSLGSGNQHNITYCSFINCRAVNGGGIYSLATSIYAAYSCFYLCSQGSTWPAYGASIYSKGTGNQIIDNIHSFMCPGTNESPWHSQIDLNSGKAHSTNINASHCGAQYSAGISHHESYTSTCSNILSANNIAGNSVAFSYTSNQNNHRRIGFINNTLSKGHFYVYQITASFSECMFIHNTGIICFTHSTVSSITFYDCLFDSSPSWGTGVSLTYNISTSTNYRTMIPFSILNNERCKITLNEKCEPLTCQPNIIQYKIHLLSLLFYLA